MQYAPVYSSAVMSATSEADRRTFCAWCWKRRHPDGTPYPEQWSSTICADCEAEILAALERTRAARRKSA